jgi:prevent-host-death family protein
MKSVSVHEAKTHLSQLIRRACDGDDVVIRRGKQPVVRLVPVARAAPVRKFGAWRGKLRVDRRFFEALPDEELAAWER